MTQAEYVEWMIRRRKRLRLSQRNLADRSGYPVSSISNWERKKSIPSFTAALDLAQALDAAFILVPTTNR